MWIIRAWQHIAPEVTLKDCKKCCISTATDGTDDMLWNGSVEVQNMRSECEVDEGTDYGVGDSDTDW